MSARWRQAKLHKMSKERRQAPRSLGVNWHNGRAMKAGSIDLELEGRVAEEMETRKPRAPSIKEIGITFNNMRREVYMRTMFLKVVFFWTPQRDVYYVVCYNYKKKIVQVSMSYNCRAAVESAWQCQSVKWKYKRKLA